MNQKLCFYMPPFPSVKSYYDMVDVAKEYGLSAVEGFNCLDFETPDKEEAKKIRAYADEKEITFPCFSVYINVVGKDSFEMVERLKGYADVATILGSPYLHHTVCCEFSNPDKVLPYQEEFFETGIKAIRQVYDYAESIGIKTIYEEQGYLFNGIKGFGRLVNAVDREIGAVADFANIYQSGDSPLDFIKTYKDLFVHAHIKDITLTDTNETGEGLKTLTGQYMVEAPIGQGIVPIPETINALKEAGYTGSYGIEYSAKTDDSPEINNALSLISCLL